VAGTDDERKGMGGRRREAARNDVRILESARSVFVDNPRAPVSEVSRHAGVGIGALYRRYPTKDALVGAVCAEGQERYIAVAEAALAHDEPYEGFVQFLRQIVEADTHTLVLLAGRFTPDPEHWARAARMRELGTRLLERAQEAGAVRADINYVDLSLLLELVSAVRLDHEDRTREVRQRYLTVIIDALTTPEPTDLATEPPTWDEQSERWTPRPGRSW
jgi:AcrR family transcriptional regulator